MQFESEQATKEWEEEVLQFLRECINNQTVTIKDFLVSVFIFTNHKIL